MGAYLRGHRQNRVSAENLFTLERSLDLARGLQQVLTEGFACCKRSDMKYSVGKSSGRGEGPISFSSQSFREADPKGITKPWLCLLSAWAHLGRCRWLHGEGGT